MKVAKGILALIKSLEEIYLVETLTENCFFPDVIELGI